MQIRERITGVKAAVKDLQPFAFFWWNGQLFMKLRDRNVNLVDIWNVKSNMPDWIMPSTIVQTVDVIGKDNTYMEKDDFGYLAWGEIFQYNGMQYLKAYTVQDNKDDPKGIRHNILGPNAFCMVGNHEAIRIGNDEPVARFNVSYTIIRAAE